MESAWPEAELPEPGRGVEGGGSAGGRLGRQGRDREPGSSGDQLPPFGEQETVDTP